LLNIRLTACFLPFPNNHAQLIDFGGACYDDDKKSSIINTRQYRAPEVILGIGWSMPSDMWSCGCILAELFKGQLLFATHDNLEHLALMERIISPFPHWMLKEARGNVSASGGSNNLAHQAFDQRTGRHRLGDVLSAESVSCVRRSQHLESIICGRNDDYGPSSSPVDDPTWLLELLRRILVIDPEERSTAHECLQFLSRTLDGSRRGERRGDSSERNAHPHHHREGKSRRRY